MSSAPPQWRNGDMAQGLSEEWVLEVVGPQLGIADETVGVESMTDLVDSGGFMGEIVRIKFTNGKSVIFKQLATKEKIVTSKVMGLSREAHFYNSKELAGHPLISEIIAKAYYAFANEESGERFLMLEDLGRDGVQFGLLCGPGNPNNWAKVSNGELSKIEKSWGMNKDKLSAMCETVFRAAAHLHASFWNQKTLLDIPWLRSTSLWSSPVKEGGEDNWNSSMGEAQKHWSAFRSSNADPDPSIWDPLLIDLVDASFTKASYTAYMQLMSSSPFTLIHGDFHAANLMWVRQQPEDSPVSDIKHVKCLDWEMVGVGSGPQELGQFVISHIERSFRISEEEKLVRAYHAELMSLNPTIADAYSFEACFNEYVQGGLGRWLWFVGWMSTVMPPAMMKFFNEQTLAFATDHGFTCENVPLPRV